MSSGSVPLRMFIALALSSLPWSAAAAPAGRSGCTAAACHEGIEGIRAAESEMMKSIVRRGNKLGDLAGCVVCHGGDPRGDSMETAHRGPAAR